MAVWSNVRRWTLYKTHLVAVQEVKLIEHKAQKKHVLLVAVEHNVYVGFIVRGSTK